jgi:hypothetical protein
LTGRLVVDELRCEGGEVGDVPLEGVTTRGLGEEEAEGGGFWGFLSRRKVNLPSRELMEDMCGERPKAEREEEGRKRERERTCQRREKGKGRGEGGGVRVGEWRVEVRRGRGKTRLTWELGIRGKEQNVWWWWWYLSAKNPKKIGLNKRGCRNPPEGQ